jgi:hypothetical protein
MNCSLYMRTTTFRDPRADTLGRCCASPLASALLCLSTIERRPQPTWMTPAEDRHYGGNAAHEHKRHHRGADGAHAVDEERNGDHGAYSEERQLEAIVRQRLDGRIL